MVDFQSVLTQLARNVLPDVPTESAVEQFQLTQRCLAASLPVTPRRAPIGRHLTLHCHMQLSSIFILRMHCTARTLTLKLTLCFLQRGIMYIVNCKDKCLICIEWGRRWRAVLT